jgi:hypothetical protein
VCGEGQLGGLVALAPVRGESIQKLGVTLGWRCAVSEQIRQAARRHPRGFDDHCLLA